ESGKVAEAGPGEFEAHLEKHKTYFLNGTVTDPGSTTPVFVTDRKSDSLAVVPHQFLKAPSFLPTWMVAYNYPQNVNKDGIVIPGNKDEHNRVLPQPVFPTPFYETIICTFLFLIMWAIRKRIMVAGTITGIYFILNGLERFIIEKIRVNNHYHAFGIQFSQAQMIALLLMLGGLLIVVFVQLRAAKTKQKS
ncbi:MAG: prolipoprotein diacylglyceryl transferase family protein, partial [Ferruginibacter sp.]